MTRAVDELPGSGSSRRPASRRRAYEQLSHAAHDCRDCPIGKNATQVVFGEGSVRPKLFFIGEQAGDREDLQGRPFVGPAGNLLDQVLEEIGISRRAIYITNVIKHFKFELRGKRRIHVRADAKEIAACLQWLEQELALTKAKHIVCLGAMASKVIFGSGFSLMRERGQWLALDDGRWAIATVHPAFVLRARAAGDYDAAHRAFRSDLRRLLRLP